MPLQLLCEEYLTTLPLVEGESGSRPGVLASARGVPLIEVDKRGRNGRRYTKKLWERVLESPYVKEMQENHSLFGEADHPRDGRIEVSIPHISHSIYNMRLTESCVVGDLDILDTPAGRILYTVARYGSKVGMSARGAGSLVKEPGGFLVEESSYVFRTFDAVTYPSYQDSRLGIVSESVEVHEEALSSDLEEEILEQIMSSDEPSLRIIREVLSHSGSRFQPLIERIDRRIAKLTKTTSVSVLKESLDIVKELKEQVESLGKVITESRVQSHDRDSNSLGPDSEFVLSEKLAVYEQDIADRDAKIATLTGLVKDLSNKLSAAEAKVVEGSGQPVSEDVAAISELRSLLEEKESKVQILYDEAKDLDEKVRVLREENESLMEEVAESRESLSAFREAMIKSLLDRIGVERNVVLNMLPKNFIPSDIEVVEKSFLELRRRGSRDLSAPVEAIVEGVQVSETRPLTKRLIRAASGK